MSEQDPRSFGPAAGYDGERFVMMVPFRKSTTTQFSMEAIQDAVRVFLVDSLPPGIEIDTDKPQDVTWSEEYITRPGFEQQVLVRIAVFVKERVKTSE